MKYLTTNSLPPQRDRDKERTMTGLEVPHLILHTFKAWLYENYLKHVEGKYIARVKAEKPLSIENIAASATTRGGAKMSSDTMVESVKLFYAEAMYQLADGFSIDNGYYSIHPTIRGAFENVESPVDPEKNKVDFTFQKRKGMRDLLKFITVKIQGVAQTDGFIGDIQDVTTQSIDDALTPGGVLIISGYKIKIAGPDEDNGIYFVETTSGSRTKVTSYLVENRPSRVIIQTPALAEGVYHIEIRTQYVGSTTYLKAPRVVEYTPDLTVSPIVPVSS
jgi:hypothetical protein